MPPRRRARRGDPRRHERRRGARRRRHPLTHRGVSHLFTVVSGHAPLTDGELEHLAGLGGTIVVLMGVNSLPSLTAGLARHGMPAGMPVAIIERGFRADQRTTVGDLADIVFAAGRAR